ncbi:MAG TPA: hypothetical protein VML55_07125 [Planctomycetaceae bacterium]|nr:hypothetical protein [Planctomycetaceae bacterium]
MAAIAVRHSTWDTGTHGFSSERAMSLQELEAAVASLSDEELPAFAQWFEEYLADAWDRRIEADIQAGRLDEAGRRAEADFEAGRCQRVVAGVAEARREFAAGQCQAMTPIEIVREAQS